MRIDLAFPVLPPELNGIGDYTACLARTLATRCFVKVLAGPRAYDSIAGVDVESFFSVERPRDVVLFAEAVLRDPPDWLVLQYNPFSYGRWGLNPYLPFAVRRIKRQAPATRIALMVHEPFVPVTNWKWAIETTWQRWQMWMLARAADVVFFSIDPWVRRFQRWFPGKPVLHLPVGSNIPRETGARRRVRKELGVDEETLVVGVFGSAHHSRLLPFIRAAVEAMDEASEKLHVLYIGPHGDHVRDALDGLPLTDAGPLPARAVSEHFSAMDLYLAPFEDGVSSRRGSFMVGIQHGVPTVSTFGAHTDEMLSAQHGTAFLLAPDHDKDLFTAYTIRLAHDVLERSRLGKAGQDFFDDHFAWERVADTLIEALDTFDTTGSVKAHSPLKSAMD